MVCVQKFTLMLWLTRGRLFLLYLFTELHLFIILPLISDSVSITPNAVLQRTGVKASRGRVKLICKGLRARGRRGQRAGRPRLSVLCSARNISQLSTIQFVL